MLPLAGITVVALEQAIAAPFATRQLADLGARVIKIERPDSGDFARDYDAKVSGLSSQFVWANRGKESLTLDLKRPEATTILDRLPATADVFIQNLLPGATERLGLAAATLRQKYPRLIICDLSGYGSTGPYRDKKAYDLLIQSEAGLLSITGTEETPSKVGISIADIAAAMYVYSGVLTALLVRAKTGEGAVLEVSLFEALGEWMGYPAYYTEYGGAPPPRTGASHAVIAPYGPWTSADNQVLFLGVQNEREWLRFCEIALRRPELVADGRFTSNTLRVEHRKALDAIVASVFAQLPVSEMAARLDAAQIAYARLNSVQDFVDHPQLAARHRWRTVDSPAGPLRALLPPVTISGVEPNMGAIPALGEHTAAILKDLGFDAAQIAAWKQAGVI
jgi:itaconate CoA-transferase